MDQLIGLLVVGFVTALGCLMLWKLFDIVRSSIKGNKKSLTEEDFDRLAQAFMQHKKKMQERVRNLEIIIADKEEKEDNYSQIEASNNDGSLTNDLYEKDRVSS